MSSLAIVAAISGGGQTPIYGQGHSQSQTGNASDNPLLQAQQPVNQDLSHVLLGSAIPQAPLPAAPFSLLPGPGVVRIGQSTGAHSLTPFFPQSRLLFTPGGTSLVAAITPPSLASGFTYSPAYLSPPKPSATGEVFGVAQSTTLVGNIQPFLHAPTLGSGDASAAALQVSGQGIPSLDTGGARVGVPQGSGVPSQSGDYKIDAGDSLALYVYNHPELSGILLVPSGGIVQFPLVGDVQVIGRTLDQITAIVTRLLKRDLKRPIVSISVAATRPNSVSVMGDVQRPSTVGTGNLAQAISSAGGLLTTLKPEDTTVTVIPKNGTPQTFQLTSVLAGDADSNISLNNGDVVNVDSGLYQVFVAGQVKLPGVQTLTRRGGLLAALASSGGPTDGAAISKVRIAHANGQSQVVDLVPSLIRGEAQNLPALQKGDTITVPVDTNQLAVLGYVTLPGTFVIPDGFTYRLSDALSLVHGQDAAKRGSLNNIVVVHIESGKTTYAKYKFGRYVKLGDLTQNPVLRPNDVVYVPETNAAPITLIVSAIASAGIFFNAVK